MQFDQEKHVLVKFLCYMGENVGVRLGRKFFPLGLSAFPPLSLIYVSYNYIITYIEHSLYIYVGCRTCAR